MKLIDIRFSEKISQKKHCVLFDSYYFSFIALQGNENDLRRDQV